MPDQSTATTPAGVTRWRPKLSVEAVRLTGDAAWDAIAQWCVGSVDADYTAISVPVAGGEYLGAREGSWIVKGSHSFMVFGPAAFADTYEPAEPPVPAGEPWPAWLADLTPERRVQEILIAVEHRAERYGQQPQCSAADAEQYLLRLLAEAAQGAADGPEPAARGTASTGAGDSPSDAAMDLLEEAWGLIATADELARDGLGSLRPGDAESWRKRYQSLVREHAAGQREAAGESQQMAAPPLPPGEYARVEIMGHDAHTGWVTDSTRAGQPVMVIRDWDGQVIAEVPGHSLYRFVPLATPLKRPEPVQQPRELMSGSRYEDDYDWRERDGEPF